MNSELQTLLEGHRPLSLKSLTIPASLRVSFLAPHPDDFDAIGITMRFFRRNGNDINVVLLTSGASGVEDGFGGAWTAEAKALLREEEQRASCRFFGLTEKGLSFLRLSEDDQGHPANTAANLEAIRGYLMTRRPQFVFLPHGNDTNLGHQRTYALLRKVLQEEKLSAMAFLNRDPKTVVVLVCSACSAYELTAL